MRDYQHVLPGLWKHFSIFLEFQVQQSVEHNEEMVQGGQVTKTTPCFLQYLHLLLSRK
jgi:hypothetical protein